MERNDDERRIQRGKSRGKETAVLSRVASGQGNRSEQPGKQGFLVYTKITISTLQQARAPIGFQREMHRWLHEKREGMR